MQNQKARKVTSTRKEYVPSRHAASWEVMLPPLPLATLRKQHLSVDVYASSSATGPSKFVGFACESPKGTAR